MTTTPQPNYADFPDIPTFEAEWAPLYLEPIVQSGERITIAVVATSGGQTDGQIAISERALQCLYGDSSAGMQGMIVMAMKRALSFAAEGFQGEFRSGMHGVMLGKKRLGLGDNLHDVIEQAISLTSSLSALHGEEESRSGHDRSSYWKKFQLAMKRVDPELSKHFGHIVDVKIKDSVIPLQCDYFSSRLAVNICGVTPGSRLNMLFDAAVSRICRLEQIKKHDGLIAHHQKSSMVIVMPSPLQLDGLKAANLRSFHDRVLLLQDMADERDFLVHQVHSPLEGAKQIHKLETLAA